MRIEPLGEFAYLLRDLSVSAPLVAEQLNLVPGVAEAYAAFDAVGVVLQPGATLNLDGLSFVGGRSNTGKLHEIPVLYDGPDLAEVAELARLRPEEVVDLHSGGTFDCGAVGFCPGFAYLTGLPDPLATLPRRATPRVRVEPGSVALAAGMTAVYPMLRPGGWWLIGRTPLTLVDPESDYFPITAGDRVKFRVIDAAEFVARQGQRL